MRLVSDRIEEGRPGPVYGERYPRVANVDLNDIRRFTAGQPWAPFAEMRETAPVMWHPEPAGRPGYWAVTSYEGVRRVNGDPDTFSSERGGINIALPPPERRADQLFLAATNTMIDLDGPAHRQLRREHMPFFTAGYLKKLRARVAAEVTRLLDAMPASGACDFVGAFAGHLPAFTLCEMLGVPEGDRPKFLRWIHFLEMSMQVAAERGENGGTGELTPEMHAFLALFEHNVAEMFAYGRDMMAKRRADPRDDLLTAIACAEVEGERLPDTYLDGSWLLIVFAGNDTTRNTLSGGVKLFTENPGEKARLLGDPSLLPNAVHEITRVVSPVIYMKRTATRDVEVEGQRIAEGEKVVMWYGAANRDPSVFPDPDRFDVARPNAERNIAFGHGPHLCIGRLAAQLQLEESYAQLFRRFPDLRWEGDYEVAPNNFVHGIRRLEVRY